MGLLHGRGLICGGFAAAVILAVVLVQVRGAFPFTWLFEFLTLARYCIVEMGGGGMQALQETCCLQLGLQGRRDEISYGLQSMSAQIHFQRNFMCILYELARLHPLSDARKGHCRWVDVGVI